MSLAKQSIFQVTFNTFFVGMLVFGTAINPAQGLKCYHCSEEAKCDDKHHGELQECPAEMESPVCTEIKFKGKTFIGRNCMAKKQAPATCGNPMEDDTVTVAVCICEDDGCNAIKIKSDKGNDDMKDTASVSRPPGLDIILSGISLTFGIQRLIH